MNMKEPKVEVGILFESQIEFVLLAPYRTSGKEVSGKQVVTYDEGKSFGTVVNMTSYYLNPCRNLLRHSNCWM